MSEIEVLETPEIVGQRSIYLSTDPMEQLNEARQRARVLVEMVNEQGLARNFGGERDHVSVEGWQFLASQFGLIPDIEWTKELDDGWEARAKLVRLSDGVTISHAEAECRRTEKRGFWHSAEPYAIRSMAQTRAVSKVCRIALSSVMVLGGFAATPAEEMDGVALTQNDPHCPACLKENGELVGVWQNDRKPFWKCKAKENCAAWDGSYAWSGWHESWENSVADFLGQPVTGEPQTKTIEDERTNRTGYIVHQAMELSGTVSESEIKLWVKPGLLAVIESESVDTDAALGGPISESPTDDELRVVLENLTLAEADALAAAVATVYLERPYEDE